jgi:hypothetical protein
MPDKPKKIWVEDITYIPTEVSFIKHHKLW